jgi:4-amino-4-deoxychorismate lyase
MIDPLDEGFRYGRGVFETVRVHQGRPLLLVEHIASMNEAAIALGLDNSRIHPGPVPGSQGIWRWFLTPLQFLTTWDDGAGAETEGAELGLSRLRVSSQSWEARYKTLSYLLQVQAREESLTGWDVLLNEKGHLAGVTMANLFWVRDGAIFTPSPDCGCRNGAVRRWVMAYFPQTREVEVGPGVLEAADEIFLTNSRVGILPVTAMLSRSLVVGKRTGEIRMLYESMVTASGA